MTQTVNVPETARAKKRHLLDLQDWSVEDVAALFNTADVMAQVMTRTIKKVPALQGFHGGHALFRALDPDPAEFRAGGAGAVGRRAEFRGGGLEPRQRRIPERHP